MTYYVSSGTLNLTQSLIHVDCNCSGVMVQDGGCGHIVDTRISGGRTGFGFSTQGSARLSNCIVAGVHFGVSVIVNRPAEVVMEDNDISAKMSVIFLVVAIAYISPLLIHIVIFVITRLLCTAIVEKG